MGLFVWQYSVSVRAHEFVCACVHVHACVLVCRLSWLWMSCLCAHVCLRVHACMRMRVCGWVWVCVRVRVWVGGWMLLLACVRALGRLLW